MSSIFKPSSRAARPLGTQQSGAFNSGSLGMLSPYTNSGIRGMVGALRGLGAVKADGTAAIPWQCWSAPGFQDCHAKQYAAAVTACDASTVADVWGGNKDACIGAYADSFDIKNCVPKYCPDQVVTKAVKTYPAATLKAIQQELNVALAANGLKTLTVDGKIGPSTVGAASYLQNTNPVLSNVYSKYQLAEYYKGPLTNPTKAGSTVPLTTYVTNQTTVISGQPAVTAATPQWGVADPSVAALQAQLNQILDANGYLAIPVSGKLDAQTCGAMRWVKDNTGQDYLFASGGNCQAFTLPTKRTAINSPPGSPPPTDITQPPAPGISKASLMTGGLLLLAAGGAYYYAKKKGMV